MTTIKLFLSKVVLALLLLLGSSSLSSCTNKNENWPQFRGPNSNQITLSNDLPLNWSNEENLDQPQGGRATGLFESPDGQRELGHHAGKHGHDLPQPDDGKSRHPAQTF